MSLVVATKFSECLHGHDSKNGCTNDNYQAMQLLSDWLDAVNRSDSALLVLLNLSVDHEIPLERLCLLFGMGDLVLDFSRLYLIGRTQHARCRCDGVNSDVVRIICGVPQGVCT